MAAPAKAANPESFSTAHVARRLGVSVPTVQRWVDQGHLKAWKTVGGHRRIEARSVIALEADQGLAALGVRDGATSAPSLSVLVVDDNPDDRDLLSAVVLQALPGARVAVAENGFEALLMIGQHTPDVLITDIVMPHMDGLEMLRHLSSPGSARSPLIVATSSHRPEQLVRMGPLPADVHFVPKPIDPKPLLALLRGARLAPTRN
ncbi:MAG: response regulator [Burkholderiales bacterium]|nr:response regulator [Burkholderiales bacterium]